MYVYVYSMRMNTDILAQNGQFTIDARFVEPAEWCTNLEDAVVVEQDCTGVIAAES